MDIPIFAWRPALEEEHKEHVCGVKDEHSSQESPASKIHYLVAGSDGCENLEVLKHDSGFNEKQGKAVERFIDGKPLL